MEKFLAIVEAVLKWLFRPVEVITFDPEIDPLDVPQEPPQAPVSVPKPEVVETPVIKPKPVKMTNSEKLYKTAFDSVGKDMSPADVAPDSLGCAESLNGVFKAAFGKVIGDGSALTSTYFLYQVLKLDTRFEEVGVPQAGDIVISPTGYSVKGSSNGHCGVWGNHDVMSNDSNSGLWSINYTHEAWNNVFHVKLGFPTHFFRVK